MEDNRSEKESLRSTINAEFDFLRGNYLLIVLSWLIVDFFTEVPSTYYPLFVQSLGGTATAIGLIGFIDMFSMALVQIPGGYVADRYGRKKIIVYMTFMIMFSILFFVFATNWLWILIGTFVGGMARIYLPAIESIIADSLPSNRRGMGYSLIKLITQLSTTPSPLFAAYLLGVFGLDKTMRISYSLLFIALMLAGFLRSGLTETMTDIKEDKSISLRELIFKSYREGVNVWNKIPKPAFTLLILQLITYFSISLQHPILVLYIIEDLGVSKQNYSFILSIVSVTVIVLALPVGKIVDLYGRKKPLLISNILVLLIIPLIIFGDFLLLVVALSFFSFLQLLFSTASAALNVDLVPKELRGKVMGVTSFCIFTAMSLGELVGGFMYDIMDHKFPFILHMALMLPSIALIYWRIKEPLNEEPV